MMLKDTSIPRPQNASDSPEDDVSSATSLDCSSGMHNSISNVKHYGYTCHGYRNKFFVFTNLAVTLKNMFMVVC